jgi:hypothetical protein
MGYLGHLGSVQKGDLTPLESRVMTLIRLQIQFAEILLSHFVYGLTKVSVVFFYRRIFTVGYMVITTNLLLVAIALFILVSFFVRNCDRQATPMN